MSLANTKTFDKSLDREVMDIFFNDYMEHKTEYDKIANVAPAPAGAHYTQAELSSLGAMQKKPEGSPISFDNPVEGNEVRRTYTSYGLGFQITEEMLQDDLHGNFKQMPQELARSAAVKRETQFWDLFNSGFDTHKAWDGNYIWVASGRTTLKSGDTQNNRPSVDASLSETSLQAAFEYYDNLVDSAGRPLTMDPQVLIIPTELQWTASVLSKTMYKPGSMDNDINTVKDRGGWTVHVSKYLTSSTAWFLNGKSSMKYGFNFLWKKKANIRSWDDAPTGNRLYGATMRFVPFCNNPIITYGTTGA